MDGSLLIAHAFVYVNTAGAEDPIAKEHLGCGQVSSEFGIKFFLTSVISYLLSFPKVFKSQIKKKKEEKEGEKDGGRERERRENQGCVSDFSDCLYIFRYPRVIAKYFKMTPGGPLAI